MDHHLQDILQDGTVRNGRRRAGRHRGSDDDMTATGAPLAWNVLGMARYPAPHGRRAPHRGSGGPVRRTDSRVSTSGYLENILSVVMVTDPPILLNGWRASVQALWNSIGKNSNNNLTGSFLPAVLGRTCP